MRQNYFFGYGSLVNRRTHVYEAAHPAKAVGWRRAWRATADRKIAILTVIPAPACTTDGLIAHVPNNDWAALDKREAAYQRLPAASSVLHEAGQIEDIAIYAVNQDHLILPDEQRPILLSYLDVVIQGYLREYGAKGPDKFFETTTGWEAPVLNDRAVPRYPRAQNLTTAERAVVDSGLAHLGTPLIFNAG